MLAAAALFAFRTFKQTERQAEAAEAANTVLREQRDNQNEAFASQLTELKRQADAAESQRDDAKVLGGWQAKTAERQAEAAERQIETMLASAAVESRARSAAIRPKIKIETCELKLNELTTHSLHMIISNLGETPVRKFESKIKYRLYDLYNDFYGQLRDLKLKYEGGKTFIIQGRDELELNHWFDLPEDEYKDHKGENLTLALLYEISWVDSLDWRISEVFEVRAKFTNGEKFQIKEIDLVDIVDSPPENL